MEVEIVNRRLSSSFIPLEDSLTPFPKRKRTPRVEYFPEGFDRRASSSSSCNQFSVQETSPKNYVDHEKEGVHKRQKLSTIEEEVITEKGFKNRILEDKDCSGQKFPEKMMTKKKMNGKTGSNKKVSGDDGPTPPPGMPQGIKNLISELVGGNRVISMEKLVVQRKLEHSDIKGDQNRFSIPRGKLREQFLQGDEKHKKDQLVNIIDPSLNDHIVKLSKWNPEKPFHVLNGPAWKEIIKTNRLCTGMIMQLWAVRADDELWLVLVNLTPPTENVVAAQGSDYGGSTSTEASEGSSENC